MEGHSSSKLLGLSSGNKEGKRLIPGCNLSSEIILRKVASFVMKSTKDSLRVMVPLGILDRYADSDIEVDEAAAETLAERKQGVEDA